MQKFYSNTGTQFVAMAAASVKALLKRMGLEVYFDAFEEEGFDSIDRVALMDEEDVDAVLAATAEAGGDGQRDGGAGREGHREKVDAVRNDGSGL